MIMIFIIDGFIGGLIQYTTSQSIYDSSVRAYIRRQWEAERRGWERERQREEGEAVERRRQREEARRRSQIHWLALESLQHCERYGTWKNWAELCPLVGGYDPVEASWTSEIEIHGWKMKLTDCKYMVCSADPSFSLLTQLTGSGSWGIWLLDSRL